MRPDAQGRYHDDNGQFVSIKDYIERILAEQEKTDALVRTLTDRAFEDMKDALGEMVAGVKVRLDRLESGGAPFASRLDQGLTALKNDVDTLKTVAVRTEALNAVRDAGIEEAREQRRQIKLIVIGVGFSLLLSLVSAALQLIT